MTEPKVCIGLGTFEATPKTREYVDKILSTGQITYSTFSRRFERDFANIHGCRYGILSNSGTSSLQVALQALKEYNRWPDGTGVIIPATTFIATCNIVLHCNMTPVIVDVDPDTYNIDVEKVDSAIDAHVRAVIPVHMFGQPANMHAIRDISFDKGISVIEDSCFTGNTLIPTKTGQKRIKDVITGDELLGFNGTSFVPTTVVGTMSRLVPYTDLLVIKFENGATVRCTKNHPFFVGGEWREAGSLSVGEEAWQCTWGEYTSWRRDYKLSETGRKIISSNMRENNPSFSATTIRKSFTNRKHKISRIESRVIQSCKEYDIPLDYVGDGSLWIGDEQSGYKNPDFVLRGGKLVVEVFDPTFKYHNRRDVFVDRNNDWEEERRSFFGKFGYKTKFVKLSGYVGRKARERLAFDLRQAVSNGVKIVSIKSATKGFCKRYNNGEHEPDGMVRVYNLHCEPHNSFVISSGILVHNCETMFATHNGQPVGAMGNIGCFSLYAAHLIVGGVGGLSTTNNPELAKIMRSLVNHGMSTEELNLDDNFSPRPAMGRSFTFDRPGHSYRITEFEAALALAQLDNWKDMIRIRRRNAQHLNSRLFSCDAVKTPIVGAGNTHSYMMYPIILRRGDKQHVMKCLNENGIQTRDMPTLIHQPAVGWIDANNYPVSQNIYNNGFYVGCHQGLSIEDMDYVADMILRYTCQ